MLLFDFQTLATLPLIVDTLNILKFTSTKLITGINIIEGMLAWTDNQTEPKKITIKEWVGSTPNFIFHSKVYGRNFIESDITVIKKYPLQPPTITAFSTSQKTPNGEVAVVSTQANANFAEIAPNSGGAIVAMTSLSPPLTIN